MKKGYILSVYVDDIKLAGKKRNIDPMWEVLNKEVDLGEPTSFLDYENLGCTQRQCEISNDIVHNYRAMFESRISEGRTEKTSILGEFSYFLRGPTIWKVMLLECADAKGRWPVAREGVKHLRHAFAVLSS